ncbi:MAG: LPS export ABC transporter permease LptG [Alphaproteobacteria bacterium]
MFRSRTISGYIARLFLFWFVAVMAAVMAVILLIDLIELVRRAAGKPEATFDIVFRMALLHIPHLLQEIIPFAVLYGTMVAFVRLTRAHELVVVRAAGLSVWQFLQPALLLAFVIGMIKITLLDPAAAIMLSKFEELEGRYVSGKSSLLAVSSSGMWLRQVDTGGDEAVIHARRVVPAQMELQDVIVFLFEGRDRFAGRIDAASARLTEGYWELDSAWMTGPDLPGRRHETYRFETDLTAEKIQESFASPETISLWQLPGFIKVLEDTGFSSVSHQLRLYSLLAEPLLLMAIVMVAVTFSLRPSRRGGTGALIGVGVVTGFALYLLTNIVHALGLGTGVPVIFSAFMPAVFTLALGLSFLLHLEDG